MGKPERKQSEAAAGAGKLSLGPLIAKPGKTGSSAANPKQQLLAHPNSTGTAGSTNISGLKQLLSAKLAELDATVTSSASRVRDQLDKAEAALETAAKGHQAAAQQALQSAGQTLDMAEKRHNEAKKQLTQEQKELTTHMIRAYKDVQTGLDNVANQAMQRLTALRRKAGIKSDT